MNLYNPSPACAHKKRLFKTGQTPGAATDYARWPLATNPYLPSRFGRRQTVVDASRGPSRRSSPESCPTGFKKLLSHGSRIRSHGGRRVAVLQRHKHHIGHDLVLHNARRRLSRAFAYIPVTRLRLVLGMVADLGLRSKTTPRNRDTTCPKGRLAYAARLVEGFYEPSLSRLGWYRGLRHARQARRHAATGSRVSPDLRGGVGASANTGMPFGVSGRSSQRCLTTVHADRTTWRCVPGGVAIINPGRL